MKLSRLVAELGPSLLGDYIKNVKESGADTSFLEEHGTTILNAVTDQLLTNEVQSEDRGKAKFIAHLAADLLRGWPGEPSLHYAEAVRVAVQILELSEKAVTDPDSRA